MGFCIDALETDSGHIIHTGACSVIRRCKCHIRWAERCQGAHLLKAKQALCMHNRVTACPVAMVWTMAAKTHVASGGDNRGCLTQRPDDVLEERRQPVRPTRGHHTKP